MKVWLIGEQNPLSADRCYDLYPKPDHSTGGRLCGDILGLGASEYLRKYERRNLLGKGERWSARSAREAASLLRREIAGAPTVLLGAKVAAAFGLVYSPFMRADGYHDDHPHPILILPHPSGRCLAWNKPGAFLAARACVEALA